MSGVPHENGRNRLYEDTWPKTLIMKYVAFVHEVPRLSNNEEHNTYIYNIIHLPRPKYNSVSELDGQK
jgi:hypothetical protein